MTPRRLIERSRRTQRRIDALEAEVQECRDINLRVAELVDAVTELLIPLADQGDPRTAAIIERYGLGVSTEGKRSF